MEIEIGGHKYLTQKLNAVEQWNLSRKLLPVMTKIGDVARFMTSVKAQAAGFNLETFGPIAEAFASMPQDDSDMILSTCLSKVYRMNGAGLAPVWNREANKPQFEDIDMLTMLRLVYAVIKESMENFTQGLPPLGLTVGTQGPASSL